MSQKRRLIWIVGEYANKIENADELLSVFVETFTGESYSVRIPIISRYFCYSNPCPCVYIVGATSDAHCSREILSFQARLIPRFGPACS